VVIGIGSSGLHTNGYSLARKIFFEQLRLKPGSYVRELKNTIGKELLKVHLSYGPLVQALIATFNPAGKREREHSIRAFAHITGGGFVDNIPRVLPADCDVVIRKGSWEMLPIFKLIAAKGDVPEHELYQVFNMGIGMVSIVRKESADLVVRSIRQRKLRAWQIGEVVNGKGKAVVVSSQ
jgi:phosphoribosylformylglycinamidine cyclo-ligase